MLHTIPETLAKAMKETSHLYFDAETMSYLKNPYHGEGSVWDHTMLVVQEAMKAGGSDDLVTAAILHDIGKVLACETHHDNKRMRFFGHEGLSFYMANDILGVGDFAIEKAIAVHGKVYQLFHDCEVASKKYEEAASSDNPASTKKFEKAVKKYSSFFRTKKEFDFSYSLYKADNLGRVTDNKDLVEFEYFPHWAESSVIYPRKVVFLIGPPACGKSTYLKRNYTNAAVISRDNILLEQANASVNSYNEAFQRADHDAIDKALNKSFTDALNSKADTIVIDMTNCSEKSRRKFLSMMKSRKDRNDFFTSAVVFHKGYSEIMKNNRNREAEGKQFPTSLIHRFMKDFSYPSYDEFDYITLVR